MIDQKDCQGFWNRAVMRNIEGVILDNQANVGGKCKNLIGDYDNIQSESTYNRDITQVVEAAPARSPRSAA
jgi:hypothetical protein